MQRSKVKLILCWKFCSTCKLSVVPNNRNLNLPKLKAFADNDFTFAKIGASLIDHWG